MFKFKFIIQQSLLQKALILLCCIYSTLMEAQADFTESATGVPFTMKYIIGNSFSMGSNDDNDQKPIHTVFLNSFFMSKYEVTFAEYDKFCDATRREKPKDEGWGRGNRPVINVSWNDATTYCEWLSQKTGKTYRLPTEAEWEYAAKGGQSYKYAGSDDVNAVAWMFENSGYQTHNVGELDANGFGLYDMTGNVWEWCSDWYKGYSGSSGVFDGTGVGRVRRGGSWLNNARSSLSYGPTIRHSYGPTGRCNHLGFRVCLTLQ